MADLHSPDVVVLVCQWRQPIPEEINADATAATAATSTATAAIAAATAATTATEANAATAAAATTAADATAAIATNRPICGIVVLPGTLCEAGLLHKYYFQLNFDLFVDHLTEHLKHTYGNLNSYLR